MSISFCNQINSEKTHLIYLCDKDHKLSATYGNIDKLLLFYKDSDLLKKNNSFHPGVVHHSDHDHPATIIYCDKNLSDLDYKAGIKIGSKLAMWALSNDTLDITVCIDDAQLSLDVLLGIGTGFGFKDYKFDKYLSSDKKKKPTLDLKILCSSPETTAKAFEDKQALIDASNYTRDLINEPGNILYPQTYADRIKSLEADGLKVELLNKAQLEKLGMGSLLGVAQGSDKEPFVAVMKWDGANDKNESPVAFVGKGVTFDTGGISIKPSAGMGEMKGDMGGSAVVVGTMLALAKRKAKVNAVGVVGLVENMPSDRAMRPGDIVTSMSGQTVEVLNTDAEGRLVLADILWYTQEKYQPKFMIDLATLTGACIIALGHEYAALFSNDDELSAQLTQSGLWASEKLWRLPLDPGYNETIDSPNADMQNISNGRAAGTITAAEFLQRFTNDCKWAHIDIAGVTWTSKPTDLHPKVGSSFGVKLLDHFVRENYEDKA